MDEIDTPIPSATGHCLCGGVRIELTDASPRVEICHCAMCRRWGGGPFMGISGASFSISGQIFVDEKPALYDFAQETPMQSGAEAIAEAVAAGFTFPEQAEKS